MRLRSSLAAVMLLAACQRAQQGTPAPPASSSRRPLPTATAPAAPVATAAAAPSSAPLPAPLPAVSDPKLVGCLAKRCQAGRETCCVYSDESECVASVPPGPNDRLQPLASQLEACGVTKREYTLTELRRCDESSDCARSEACCSMFLFGGASADYCVPLQPAGRSPCDFVEVCIDDSTCRAARSKCIEGACRKPATPSCGGVRCGAPASACCGDPPSCRAPADCEQGAPRYRCTSPRDCLPGEHCQFAVLGTTCTNFLDVANTRVACDTAADCPKADGFCKRYACKEEQHGIKTCQCR